MITEMIIMKDCWIDRILEIDYLRLITREKGIWEEVTGHTKRGRHEVLCVCVCGVTSNTRSTNASFAYLNSPSKTRKISYAKKNRLMILICPLSLNK